MNFVTSSSLPAAFLSRMRGLLSKDYSAFLAAYDAPPARGLRVNTLKADTGVFAARFAARHGFALSPSPFCTAGLFLPPGEGSLFRAGADPLHHAGAYYMQEPSATAAVTALAPRPGERILDLCAAPGGKSTQIAAALAGSGLLWSNDPARPRAGALAQNLERCGVRNAVVSCADPAVLAGGLPGFFDAALVDAPCSGEGMFRREAAALSGWSVDNIRLCAARQAAILDAAAAAVRPGGRLLYSTCTFAPEENERQAAAFLHRHPAFTLADLSFLPFGRPGFEGGALSSFEGEDAPDGVSLSRTRRILPGDGGEGHFLALFLQTGGGPDARPLPAYPYGRPDAAAFPSLWRECFGETPPYGVPRAVGDTVRLLPEGLPSLRGLGVLAAGAAAAFVCKNRLEPHHALFMAAGGTDAVSRLELDADDPRAAAFLRGEIVAADGLRGWTAVTVDGVTAGFGKAGSGVLKNRYPKGLRLRQGG